MLAMGLFLSTFTNLSIYKEKIMTVLQIDRSATFDPVAFMGVGWSMVEQDEQSLALTHVDLTKVSFETSLGQGENYIVGEERLTRLKSARYIRLDAKVCQVLYENNDLIPESWKKPTNGEITYIFFDGTILADSEGDRNALYLFWIDDKWWYGCGLLEDIGFSHNSPSAVIVS